MKYSRLFKNIILGFGGQFVIIILGIIVPRIMIASYGSDVNGLISTISQIFTYMALLEAGIGQAARNALFKPIAENDRKEFSNVFSAAKKYFRKITRYYGFGVAVLSILVPPVIKSNVDKLTILLVILFEGMAGVISFYFIQTQTIVLMTDGRGYVNNAVNVIDKTISYIIKIIMAYFGVNIAVLQFVYFLITIAKVGFYKIYFEKNYAWLKYNPSVSTKILKDRNSYIVTEVAWTIFSSTDMIVLSMFVSTQMASVYSVYNMVFSNLNVLLNAVYISINYFLGQSYHASKKQYIKVHDLFVSIFLGGMTVLMCVAYVLIIPFIKLYMGDVADINYIYPPLPVMFALVQILSWSRYVSGNLIGIAGLISQSLKVNIAEAAINLGLSILLAPHFGVVGVLFATIIALPLKMIYCNYVADYIILKRPPFKTIRILLSNGCFFLITVLLNKHIKISINSWGNFIMVGVLTLALVGILGFSINALANRDVINELMLLLKRRRKQ